MTDLLGSGWLPMPGSCEDSNEPKGSAKARNFLSCSTLIIVSSHGHIQGVSVTWTQK
jgi:hypothetical protein